LPTSFTVLLVEDSPSDASLTREALRIPGLDVQVHVVHDGEEALEFLRRTGRHEDAPRPDLVLMDLNLPRRDGRELLVEAKSDASLRTIPFVVLTSSDADADLRAAYRANANSYLTKPTDFDQFRQRMAAFAEYWFKHASLAPG
jgi:CheY-like chemotaxis protein